MTLTTFMTFMMLKKLRMLVEKPEPEPLEDDADDSAAAPSEDVEGDGHWEILMSLRYSF